MEVLVINGRDYSKYIERKGYSWSRNDIDGPNSGRVKSTRMRRDKRGDKRSLSYKMRDVPQEEFAQLDAYIAANQEFDATYLDVHGIMTKRFYCSSVKGEMVEVQKNKGLWDNVSFTMTEV